MYTDSRGIVRFESTDNISPLHVGLNTALSSVSDRFEVVDDIAEEVEQLNTDVSGLLDLTAFSHVTVSAEGGMSGSIVAVRFGPVVMLGGRLSGTIPSEGTIVARLPEGFRPYGSLLKSLVGGSAVSNSSTRVISINGSNGNLYVVQINGGTAIDVTGVTFLASDVELG